MSNWKLDSHEPRPALVEGVRAFALGAVGGEDRQKIGQLGVAPSLKRNVEAVGAFATAPIAFDRNAVKATVAKIGKGYGAVAGHGPFEYEDTP